MTISAIKAKYSNAFSEQFSETEVTYMLASLIEKHTEFDKTQQILNAEKVLSNKTIDLIEKEVQRIFNGEPFQYVLGYTWFYDLKLKVDNRVLIPRPETEELVDWILEEQSTKEEIDILDIGTGSGCIALGLKSALQNANITAVDISEDALTVAKQNADQNKLAIHFETFDVLSYLPNKQNALYDIIVSNPPYIPINEKEQMANWVIDHEPTIALFTEQDEALIFYESILRFSRQYLKANGWLYFEIHEEKAKEVMALFERFGFTKIELKQDLQGKDRMLKALWKG